MGLWMFSTYFSTRTIMEPRKITDLISVIRQLTGCTDLRMSDLAVMLEIGSTLW